ncbi:hypothetical protein [Consotaella aegiceratis]|uniref:hypothetical protein n=1 Tax=Consotaella aegiceratis TaxID=3097961 RepID=UPI002F3F1A76
MTHLTRVSSWLAGSALLLSSGSAWAVDAQPFADHLKSVLAKQNLTLTYDGASERGDDVVLSGVEIAAEGEDTDIGELVFSNVAGSPDEGYTVGSLEKDFGEDDWAVKGLQLTNLKIAGTQEKPDDAPMADIYFDRLQVAEINTSGDEDEPSVLLKDLDLQNTSSDAGLIDADLNLASFDIAIPEKKDESGRPTLRDLGYEHFTGSVSGKAKWVKDSGEITLQPLTVTADDAGKLDFSFRMLGYTPSFIESASKIQQQMMSKPEGAQAAGMALMGLLAQLQLGQVDLSYVDDSLADKMLDFYAEKSGQPRDAYVTTLVGSLSQMLAGLQNPQFQQQVETAVKTFLEDPQSIRIAIEPDQPIVATQIMGAAMAAPQTLPDVLAVKVTANQ